MHAPNSTHSRRPRVRLALLTWLAALPGCSAAGCFISPDDDGHIEIPPTLRELPEKSFEACIYLKEVRIPAWVTSIGAYAFSGCPKLTSVIFGDPDTSRLAAIGQGAFQKTNLSSLMLPPRLRYVGKEAFQYVPNLLSVRIPASVVVLGSASFRCSSDSLLLNVTFGKPSSLVLMEARAFDGCSRLEQASVPPSCFVEVDAFRGTASAYIKAPFPPSPPSPPPALRPGEFDFKAGMASGGGIAARTIAFVVLLFACLLCACLCKARAPEPPVPVQAVVVLDGSQPPTPRRSTDHRLSRRLSGIEQAVKNKMRKEPPLPPPHTPQQRAKMKSASTPPSGRAAVATPPPSHRTPEQRATSKAAPPAQAAVGRPPVARAAVEPVPRAAVEPLPIAAPLPAPVGAVRKPPHAMAKASAPAAEEERVVAAARTTTATAYGAAPKAEGGPASKQAYDGAPTSAKPEWRERRRHPASAAAQTSEPAELPPAPASDPAKRSAGATRGTILDSRYSGSDSGEAEGEASEAASDAPTESEERGGEEQGAEERGEGGGEEESSRSRAEQEQADSDSEDPRASSRWLKV